MIELDTEVPAGTAVLRPPERLTMVVAPQLRSRIAETVAAGRTRIVVDLRAARSSTPPGWAR